jgi:hypothetical protein
VFCCTLQLVCLYFNVVLGTVIQAFKSRIFMSISFSFGLYILFGVYLIKESRKAYNFGRISLVCMNIL